VWPGVALLTKPGGLPVSAVLVNVAAIVLKAINAMMLITDSSVENIFDVRRQRPHVRLKDERIADCSGRGFVLCALPAALHTKNSGYPRTALQFSAVQLPGSGALSDYAVPTLTSMDPVSR